MSAGRARSKFQPNLVDRASRTTAAPRAHDLDEPPALARQRQRRRGRPCGSATDKAGHRPDAGQAELLGAPWHKLRCYRGASQEAVGALR